MPVDLSAELPAEAIALDITAADWRAAIEAAGHGLVAAGATTEEYTQEMLRAVEEHGPYIVVAPGIALAHSRPSPAVKRTGLSWARLAEPVEFGHAQNDPVNLVIGLAALDHEGHIGMLSSLAGILADQEKQQSLRDAPDTDALRALLAEFSA